MDGKRICQMEIFGETYNSLNSEIEKILNTSYIGFKIDNIKVLRNKLFSFWNFSRKLMGEYNYCDKDFYIKQFNDFFMALDDFCDDFVSSADKREVYSKLNSCLENFYESCFSRMSGDFIPFVHIKIFGENIYTGVKLIDAQHKSLFVFIDKFISCMVKNSTENDINKVVIFLERYSQKHFRDEEGFMEVSKYPEVLEHKAEHQKFIDTVKTIQGGLETEDYACLMENVYTALAEWLIKHILISDKNFTEYYKRYEREIQTPDKLQ